VLAGAKQGRRGSAELRSAGIAGPLAAGESIAWLGGFSRVDEDPAGVAVSDKADPKVLYFRSYLLIRAAVGFIGVVLPLLFIIGEAFIGAGVQVRGSISAYYHCRCVTSSWAVWL
jgi:hypothetical protein